MTDRLTHRGARQLTAAIDDVAQCIQDNHNLLGIDLKIAQDFAYRCDLISDAVEGRATENFGKQADFDAGSIGEVVPGPLVDGEQEGEKDFAGHFTQIEGQELQDLEMGKFASMLDEAEARLAARSKIPTIEVQGPVGFTAFIRELDQLATKAAEAKAKLEAAVPQELLDAKKSADKEYAAAQKQLRDQIVDSYDKTTNVLIKRKTKLVEVEATIQVQRKSVRGLLGLGKQSEAQIAMVNALIAEYGEGIEKFIQKTAEALDETYHDTAMVIKGWELEERAGATRTAGLLDALTKFQDFIMRGWKTMVRKFKGLVDIVSKGDRELARTEDQLVKALRDVAKMSRAAAAKPVSKFDLTA